MEVLALPKYILKKEMLQTKSGDEFWQFMQLQNYEVEHGKNILFKLKYTAYYNVFVSTSCNNKRIPDITVRLIGCFRTKEKLGNNVSTLFLSNVFGDPYGN